MIRIITRLEVCKTCGSLLDKHTILSQGIVKAAHLFIGAVVGLIFGIIISQVVIFTTIGKAVYDARVEQYQVDRETFYGDSILD